jgi:hypothetical protein
LNSFIYFIILTPSRISFKTKANENLQTLYANDDEYKHCRLECKEDDSCQLSIENLQQLLKDQQESIEQQIREFHL